MALATWLHKRFPKMGISVLKALGLACSVHASSRRGSWRACEQGENDSVDLHDGFGTRTPELEQVAHGESYEDLGDRLQREFVEIGLPRTDLIGYHLRRPPEDDL